MDGANMLRNALLIILAIGLCFGASVDVVWKTQWNYSSHNDVASSSCTDGQYVYVVGYTYNEGDGDDRGTSALIAKIDLNTGAVLSYIKYEPYDATADDDYDHLEDCVIVGNYLYAVGDTEAFGDYGLHLVKIDLSTFTKVAEYNLNYSIGGDDYWYSIETDGAYIYITGRYYTGTEFNFIIQKLDLAGNVLYTATFDGATNFYCPTGAVESEYDVFSAIKYYNGYLYVGGSYGCRGDWDGDGSTDDYDYYMVITKLNPSNLNLLSYNYKELFMSYSGGYYSNWIAGIDITDSGIYIVGYPNRVGHIWKINLGLTTINEVSWKSYFGSYNVYVLEVKTTDYGVFVFSVEYDGSYYHQILRIFDASLSLQNTIVLDDGTYDSLFGAGRFAWSDRYIYVAGFDFAPGNEEWTIYKIKVSSMTITINQPSNGSWFNTSNIDVNWTLNVSTDSNIEQKILVDGNEVWSDTNYYYVVAHKITITNPNNYDLTDYQVRIDLSSYGISQYIKVCSDLSCTQLLNFCYEQDNGECNTNPSNIIWVKVPHIPASRSTDIYVFDGETTNYAKNGDEVFDFYDDFSTDTGWYTSEASYSITTYDGYTVMSIYPTNTSANNIVYKEGFSLTSKFAVKIRAIEPSYAANDQFGLTVWGGIIDNTYHRPNQGYVSFLHESTDVGFRLVRTDTPDHYYIAISYPSITYTMWHTIELRVLDDKLIAILDDTYSISGNDTTYRYFDKVGLWVDNEDIALPTYYDYIIVRKFADQEPTISIKPIRNADTNFQRTITVPEGPHTITIQAINLDTNEIVSDSVNITVDLTPPTVQIDLNLPSNGFYTTIPSAQAKLIVNDNLSPTIHCDYTINDVNYSEDINKGGSATQNFTPADGNNKVVATCTDLAGNTITNTKTKPYVVKEIEIRNEKTRDLYANPELDLLVYYPDLNYIRKTINTNKVYYCGKEFDYLEAKVSVGYTYYRRLLFDKSRNPYVFYLIDANDYPVLITFVVHGLYPSNYVVRFYNNGSIMHESRLNDQGQTSFWATQGATYSFEIIDTTTNMSLKSGYLSADTSTTYTVTINPEIIINYLDVNLNVKLVDFNKDTNEYIIHIYGNTTGMAAPRIRIKCLDSIQYMDTLTDIVDLTYTNTCNSILNVEVYDGNFLVLFKQFYLKSPFEKYRENVYFKVLVILVLTGVSMFALMSDNIIVNLLGSGILLYLINLLPFSLITNVLVVIGVVIVAIIIKMFYPRLVNII